MSKIDTAIPGKFTGMTYRVDTPIGTMFINVMEDMTNKAIGIDIYIGKAGSETNAWSHGMARVINCALDHGASIDDIISELSNHTSDRGIRKFGDNIPVRSGPDGICVALMMYTREKYDELRRTIPPDEIEGRPRIGRVADRDDRENDR